MAHKPVLLLHIRAQLRVGVAATRQYRDEKICFGNLSCNGVVHRQRLSRPIDFHSVAGLVMDPHRRFRNPPPAAVLVTELRHHIRTLSGADAFLVVLRPQKRERNAGLCKFGVNAFVVRLHISGHRSVLLGEKNALKIFVTDVVFKRPFDPLGVGGFQHLAYCVPRASHARFYLTLTISLVR